MYFHCKLNSSLKPFFKSFTKNSIFIIDNNLDFNELTSKCYESNLFNKIRNSNSNNTNNNINTNNTNINFSNINSNNNTNFGEKKNITTEYIFGYENLHPKTTYEIITTQIQHNKNFLPIDSLKKTITKKFQNFLEAHSSKIINECLVKNSIDPITKKFITKIKNIEDVETLNRFLKVNVCENSEYRHSIFNFAAKKSSGGIKSSGKNGKNSGENAFEVQFDKLKCNSIFSARTFFDLLEMNFVDFFDIKNIFLVISKTFDEKGLENFEKIIQNVQQNFRLEERVNVIVVFVNDVNENQQLFLDSVRSVPFILSWSALETGEMSFNELIRATTGNFNFNSNNNTNLNSNNITNANNVSNLNVNKRMKLKIKNKKTFLNKNLKFDKIESDDEDFNFIDSNNKNSNNSNYNRLINYKKEIFSINEYSKNLNNTNLNNTNNNLNINKTRVIDEKLKNILIFEDLNLNNTNLNNINTINDSNLNLNVFLKLTPYDEEIPMKIFIENLYNSKILIGNFNKIPKLKQIISDVFTFYMVNKYSELKISIPKNNYYFSLYKMIIKKKEALKILENVENIYINIHNEFNEIVYFIKNKNTNNINYNYKNYINNLKEIYFGFNKLSLKNLINSKKMKDIFNNLNLDNDSNNNINLNNNINDSVKIKSLNMEKIDYLIENKNKHLTTTISNLNNNKNNILINNNDSPLEPILVLNNSTNVLLNIFNIIKIFYSSNYFFIVENFHPQRIYISTEVTKDIKIVQNNIHIDNNNINNIDNNNNINNSINIDNNSFDSINKKLNLMLGLDGPVKKVFNNKKNLEKKNSSDYNKILTKNSSSSKNTSYKNNPIEQKFTCKSKLPSIITPYNYFSEKIIITKEFLDDLRRDKKFDYFCINGGEQSKKFLDDNFNFKENININNNKNLENKKEFFDINSLIFVSVGVNKKIITVENSKLIVDFLKFIGIVNENFIPTLKIFGIKYFSELQNIISKDYFYYSNINCNINSNSNLNINNSNLNLIKPKESNKASLFFYNKLTKEEKLFFNNFLLTNFYEKFKICFCNFEKCSYNLNINNITNTTNTNNITNTNITNNLNTNSTDNINNINLNLSNDENTFHINSINFALIRNYLSNLYSILGKNQFKKFYLCNSIFKQKEEKLTENSKIVPDLFIKNTKNLNNNNTNINNNTNNTTNINTNTNNIDNLECYVYISEDNLLNTNVCLDSYNYNSNDNNSNNKNNMRCKWINKENIKYSKSLIYQRLYNKFNLNNNNNNLNLNSNNSSNIKKHLHLLPILVFKNFDVSSTTLRRICKITLTKEEQNFLKLFNMMVLGKYVRNNNNTNTNTNTNINNKEVLENKKFEKSLSYEYFVAPVCFVYNGDISVNLEYVEIKPLKSLINKEEIRNYYNDTNNNINDELLNINLLDNYNNIDNNNNYIDYKSFKIIKEKSFVKTIKTINFEHIYENFIYEKIFKNLSFLLNNKSLFTGKSDTKEILELYIKEKNICNFDQIIKNYNNTTNNNNNTNNIKSINKSISEVFNNINENIHKESLLEYSKFITSEELIYNVYDKNFLYFEEIPKKVSKFNIYRKVKHMKFSMGQLCLDDVNINNSNNNNSNNINNYQQEFDDSSLIPNFCKKTKLPYLVKLSNNKNKKKKSLSSSKYSLTSFHELLDYKFSFGLRIFSNSKKILETKKEIENFCNLGRIFQFFKNFYGNDFEKYFSNFNNYYNNINNINNTNNTTTKEKNENKKPKKKRKSFYKPINNNKQVKKKVLINNNNLNTNNNISNSNNLNNTNNISNLDNLKLSRMYDLTTIAFSRQFIKHNYEKLEFIGDTKLKFIISRILVNSFFKVLTQINVNSLKNVPSELFRNSNDNNINNTNTTNNINNTNNINTTTKTNPLIFIVENKSKFVNNKTLEHILKKHDLLDILSDHYKFVYPSVDGVEDEIRESFLSYDREDERYQKFIKENYSDYLITASNISNLNTINTNNLNNTNTSNLNTNTTNITNNTTNLNNKNKNIKSDTPTNVNKMFNINLKTPETINRTLGHKTYSDIAEAIIGASFLCLGTEFAELTCKRMGITSDVHVEYLEKMLKSSLVEKYENLKFLNGNINITNINNSNNKNIDNNKNKNFIKVNEIFEFTGALSENEINEVENILKYKFKNKGNLEKAVFHSSFNSYSSNNTNTNNSTNNTNTNTNNTNINNTTNKKLFKNIPEEFNIFDADSGFEILEFIGDAIIDIIIVERLVSKIGVYPYINFNNFNNTNINNSNNTNTNLKDSDDLKIFKESFKKSSLKYKEQFPNNFLEITGMNFHYYKLNRVANPPLSMVLLETGLYRYCRTMMEVSELKREIINSYDNFINNTEINTNTINNTSNTNLKTAVGLNSKKFGDLFEVIIGAVFLDCEMDYQIIKEKLDHLFYMIENKTYDRRKFN